MTQQAIDIIDAEDLVSRYSIEELTAAAEEYFARLESWDHLLAKPFGSVLEAPTITSHLGAMLATLRLTPGMDVLDFGAGSCWTSRIYTQLGCRVVACDVSSTALDIGRRLYELHPPVGSQPPPRFLPFDGHHVGVPAQSMDRIACMDAFHHVPNRPEILAEFARVLRPGGVAVMAEGGPQHSLTPQSQAEMRSFTVVERDIVVAELAGEAEAAGFANVSVGVYSGAPILVPAAAFEEALAHGEVAADAARAFLANHRLLVMRMAGTEPRDSRSAEGLAATCVVERSGPRAVTVTARNTGSSTWLGSAERVGAVNIGVHLFEADGALVSFDFHRVALLADAESTVAPGTTVAVDVLLPQVDLDRYLLEFDLVAEGVAWFGSLGTPTSRLWFERSG
jgi:ubiquinone/menaquinone biosynthesis C-methylase UbiE